MNLHHLLYLLHPVTFASVAVLLIGLHLWYRGRKSLHWKTTFHLSIPFIVFAAIFLGMMLAAVASSAFDPRLVAFHRLYRDFTPGMTHAEVLSAIDRHYPAHGPRTRPKVSEGPTGVGLWMHTEGQRSPGAETMGVTLVNGRLVSKSYSAD